MPQVVNTGMQIQGPPSRAEVAKTVAETGEAIATVLALVVGAIWTYMLFVRKRQSRTSSLGSLASSAATLSES